MYQLSHILNEQQGILSTLREELVLDTKNVIEEQDPADDEEEQNKKAITAIAISLIGYSGSLQGKIFIYEGNLIELDPTDYRPVCRSHLFLFHDLLIIAKVKHDKKLEFLAQHEIKKTALINIKDRDGIKNAINLITGDGSKTFQCVSASAKKEWIEKFEVAVKFNSQGKHKKGPAPKPPKYVQRQESSIDTKSITSDLSPTSSVQENYPPEWVAYAPEEIQAEIAQRHFEESLSLIQRVEDFVGKNRSVVGINEISVKVNDLKLQLSSILLQELSNAQSQNLNLALRSCRRPLKLLIDLGKAREACGILLRVCTTAIRTAQRQARRSNLAVSEFFFCDIAQVAAEFLRAFKNHTACTSALVVWCNVEIQYFASQLIKHYLTKGTQLDVVAKVVEGVREPCTKLTKLGLDLAYHMEGLLRNTIHALLQESESRLLEPIGRSEDTWQPYNLQTKSNLKATLKEFDQLGIDFRPLITGETWINLTQTTVNFCRHFLNVSESCALLSRNESVRHEAETLLKNLFLAQYKVKPIANASVDMNFVSKNKTYLTEVLLKTAVVRYESICKKTPQQLIGLQQQLSGPPKPKPRSIYKTDVL